MLLRVCLVLVWAIPVMAFAEEYRIDVIAPGHGFNGIHGLAFDAQDQLFVGSVIGQKIYKVDAETGEAALRGSTYERNSLQPTRCHADASRPGFDFGAHV